KLIKPKTLVHPAQPLLEAKKRTTLPDYQHYLFSNEPPEVVLEYDRLMKDQGVRVTGDDIIKTTPEDKQKKMKRVMKNVKLEKNPSTLSPLNKPTSETNDDIDPSLFQPINIIHPPQTSDLPEINPNTDLDTVAEGIKLATEIHKNKSNELASLLHQLNETQQQQTESQRSPPLEFLEQHLEGELPKTLSKPNLETTSTAEAIPTTHIFQNIMSATEPQNTNPEAEKIQEVETSPASEAPPSEHQSPIIFTETDIQNSSYRVSPSKIHDNHDIHDSSKLDIFSKFGNVCTDF
ncbi:hypothetical protein A2U01_0023670, partial [Trifolium medium]|nr:hypothetical protein [Trifolium medium]